MWIDAQDSIRAWLLRVDANENLLRSAGEIDPPEGYRPIPVGCLLTRVGVCEQMPAVAVNRGVTRSGDVVQHLPQVASIGVDLHEAQDVAVDGKVHGYPSSVGKPRAVMAALLPLFRSDGAMQLATVQRAGHPGKLDGYFPSTESVEDRIALGFVPAHA